MNLCTPLSGGTGVFTRVFDHSLYVEVFSLIWRPWQGHGGQHHLVELPRLEAGLGGASNDGRDRRYKVHLACVCQRGVA